jgi:prefoldin subunit 5
MSDGFGESLFEAQNLLTSSRHEHCECKSELASLKSQIQSLASPISTLHEMINQMKISTVTQSDLKTSIDLIRKGL